METQATVVLEKVEDGYSITSVHLTLDAKIPGATNDTFQELAGKAKANCPVRNFSIPTSRSKQARVLAVELAFDRRWKMGYRVGHVNGDRWRLSKRAALTDVPLVSAGGIAVDH